MPTEIREYCLGDACLCWSFGDAIALATSHTILAIYRRLTQDKRLKRLGVYDIVPSYTALAVHTHPLADHAALRRHVNAVITKLSSRPTVQRDSANCVVLPVVYDGEDLTRVARITQLPVPTIIELHSQATYLVAMIGFRPHFPYLLGLDKRLTTERLDTPRLKVQAGAVAIGGEQTGVYPEPSPGGWNIVGRTDPELLRTLSPGDTVEFRAVDQLQQITE